MDRIEVQAPEGLAKPAQLSINIYAGHEAWKACNKAGVAISPQSEAFVDKNFGKCTLDAGQGFLGGVRTFYGENKRLNKIETSGSTPMTFERIDNSDQWKFKKGDEEPKVVNGVKVSDNGKKIEWDEEGKGSSHAILTPDALTKVYSNGEYLKMERTDAEGITYYPSDLAKSAYENLVPTKYRNDGGIELGTRSADGAGPHLLVRPDGSATMTFSDRTTRDDIQYDAMEMAKMRASLKVDPLLRLEEIPDHHFGIKFWEKNMPQTPM